ncbi:AAA family ATPase [Methylobacterium sp. SI9]|uniref:AAA family ATPase n=1 Tax=Methylobacterium guangdongense TaxID=3138811 RepID=UPI00313ED92D
MNGRDSGVDRIARTVAAAATGWPVEWPSAFQDQPIPPRQWCVPDWVPDKVVTLLSGDGGTGKSLLAMQLATCCAMGLPFMGIELARRKVLYLAAEDDLDELKRRQADINKSYGIEFAELEQQLCWRVLAGEDALLARSDGKQGRTLKATATYENLKTFCVANGVQLVIVDTVADTFGGLEIDRQQVTKYVRMLEAVARATDGAVIALAHPGVAGMANGSGISGSTAWRNAVRSVIYMRRPTQEEASGPEARDLRIVERLKGNFAAAGAELRVAWWQGCFGSADSVEGMDAAIDVIATEVKVLAAIRRAHGQGRRMTFSKHSGIYAPRILKPYREVEGLKLAHIETAIASMLQRGDLREAYVGRPSHAKAYVVPGDAAPIDGERPTTEAT